MKAELAEIAMSAPSVSVLREVLTVLESYRLPLTDEKMLQLRIAEVMADNGIAFRREVRLSAADIVDFMVGPLAIEVKIKGARRAIYRQLERYCAHADVGAILLATNVPMGLPAKIAGKAAAVLNLGRGWL